LKHFVETDIVTNSIEYINSSTILCKDYQKELLLVIDRMKLNIIKTFDSKGIMNFYQIKGGKYIVEASGMNLIFPPGYQGHWLVDMEKNTDVRLEGICPEKYVHKNGVSAGE